MAGETTKDSSTHRHVRDQSVQHWRSTVDPRTMKITGQVDAVIWAVLEAGRAGGSVLSTSLGHLGTRRRRNATFFTTYAYS